LSLLAKTIVGTLFDNLESLRLYFILYNPHRGVGKDRIYFRSFCIKNGFAEEKEPAVVEQPMIPVLGRLRQEDQEFKATLQCIMRFWLKKK
jgi:hypothetical protein